MKRVFLLSVLAAGLSVGCDTATGGTGGSGGVGGEGGEGGSGVIGPLRWTVSDYTIVSDECLTADADPAFVAFDITIDGSRATLESVEYVLGGTADPYSPDDARVIFEATFNDSPAAVPDCVVELTDRFTVDLRDPTLSLDQNSTVDVTWDHAEIDDSNTAGACDFPVWPVQLQCDSQSTFTLTQQ